MRVVDLLEATVETLYVLEKRAVNVLDRQQEPDIRAVLVLRILISNCNCSAALLRGGCRRLKLSAAFATGHVCA